MADENQLSEHGGSSEVQIDDIYAPEPPKPDKLAKSEEKAYKVSGREFKEQLQGRVLNQLDTEGRGLLDDTNQRRRFAYLIFGMVCLWLASVLTLVFFLGFDLIELGDSTVLALITTSTVNVLSLLGTVVAYLFAKRGDSQWMAKAIVSRMTDVELDKIGDESAQAPESGTTNP